MQMSRQKAVLIAGPTGSGKTPLGEYFQQEGLWGERFFHFDFGAALRKIAETGLGPATLTSQDRGIITHSLETGALLEDEHFHIAKNILADFMEKRDMKRNDFLLLNGLPRHAGQAGDVDSIVELRLVIYLDCSSRVVRKRILNNSGGDRTGRLDDSPEAIENKLRLFHDRTLPIIRHYRSRKIPIEHVSVEENTSPAEIRRRIDMVMLCDM